MGFLLLANEIAGVSRQKLASIRSNGQETQGVNACFTVDIGRVLGRVESDGTPCRLTWRLEQHKCLFF